MVKSAAVLLVTALMVGARIYIPFQVHEQTISHLSAAGYINVRLLADSSAAACETASLFNSRFEASDPFGRPVHGHVCLSALNAPLQIHVLPSPVLAGQKDT